MVEGPIPMRAATYFVFLRNFLKQLLGVGVGLED
jgi:hypothetical protein